jgi:hypothetical protein
MVNNFGALEKSCLLLASPRKILFVEKERIQVMVLREHDIEMYKGRCRLCWLFGLCL